MGRPNNTGMIRDGKIVSFMLEGDLLNAVRKECFARGIAVSLWLRDAAKAKLHKKRGGK